LVRTKYKANYYLDTIQLNSFQIDFKHLLYCFHANTISLSKITHNHLQMPHIKSYVHPNTVRQLFFLALLICMGLLITSKLYFLLAAFLGAVTLYVIMLYPMKLMTVRYNWPQWVAALTLMILSLIIMVLPLVYLGSIAVEKITPLIQNPQILTDVFNQINTYLLTNFKIDIFKPENVAKITGQVIPFTQKTLGGTMSALGNVMMMCLVLYFLLVQSTDVEKWLKNAVPLKANNVKKVIGDIRNLVYSNALGIPIVAIIQGIVAMIGYSIFGVKEFVLMGILTAISSVIPIIGTMLVYIPLAIYQFSTMGTFYGAGVGIWGFLVIGSVDNIARFLVQKKLANVHPLVTLLGVFLGVSLFGFLGVIFGPLLLSVFFLLMRIYLDEFGKVDADNPDHVVLDDNK
jgi:predicted PurR-regulated permease PerM